MSLSLNFEAGINQARSVIRGEVAGSVRFMILLIAALAVWVGVSWTSEMYMKAQLTLKSQEGRYRTLSVLAAEYKAMTSGGIGKKASGGEDVPMAFAQVSERMDLGSRVNRISPSGKDHSVAINRLYAEELVELIEELAKRGVRFISAELQALPVGQERLFALSAIIGIARQ